MANMVMIAMTILVKEYVSWERSPVGWKENVTIVLESKNVARLMGEDSDGDQEGCEAGGEPH